MKKAVSCIAFGLCVLSFEPCLAQKQVAHKGVYVKHHVQKIRVKKEGQRRNVRRVRQVVDVNKADVKQLLRLKGVGKVSAARIVKYRKQHGRFARPQDLGAVRGISSKLAANLAKKGAIVAK